MGMYADEKSDGCIVPMKPRTKPNGLGGGDGGGTAAGRGEGELQRMSRTQRRNGMSLKQRAHGSELHGYPIPRMPITFDLRQEPGAGNPHAGICAGGGWQQPSLPRPKSERFSCVPIPDFPLEPGTGSNHSPLGSM